MNASKPIMRFLVWRLKHINDNNFLLIIAGLIGLVAGLAAVTLKSAVHYIQHLIKHSIDFTEINYLYLLFPAIGIALTVAVRQYVVRDTPGHGITRILRSISVNSSRIRKRYMFSNMLKSAITVGFGGSVGLEAPIVVTGSAIGSNAGQLVHLDYKKRTLLIGCGAAGAIAAIFNSPIAGVIFAIEVILNEVKISKFIPILIASVCGQLVSIVLLGDDILFSFKLTEAFQAKNTPYYILLGVLCGLVSYYFTKTLFKTEGLVGKIKNSYLRALLGGLTLAVVILTFPPLYGEGYDAIKSLLTGDGISVFESSIFSSWTSKEYVVILFLVSIVIFKPIATGLTIGSGGSGGVFAPSLFIGGVTGYLLAHTINVIHPSPNLNLSNFTLVGMCGVLSGVMHAPLTGIFLIAEITSGYMLFVPLMIVSAIAYITNSYFQKHSIYTTRLIETGQLIQHDRDQLILNQIDISKMVEKDLLTINPNATLGELVKLVKKSKRNIFPVVNNNLELEGIVTLDDIREIMFDDSKQNTIIIHTIMQTPPAHVSPQEKMQSVMHKFESTQAWNLPVIEDNVYLGFVSKSRIFNAYRTKLIRHSKE
jgi:chloride channel protein, CIC family